MNTFNTSLPKFVIAAPNSKRWIAGAFALITLCANAQAFELASVDIKQDERMAEKFTFNGMGCSGGNISPALSWKDPPEGTKSFALMVHDPDAPTGGAGIWHWVVVNIPPTATEIEQGAGNAEGTKLPAGSRQINNDYFGMTGPPAWGGPCPPKGQKAHKYNFTLYALKVEKLDLKQTATASQYGFFINLNSIGKAALTANYGRD